MGEARQSQILSNTGEGGDIFSSLVVLGVLYVWSFIFGLSWLLATFFPTWGTRPFPVMLILFAVVSFLLRALYHSLAGKAAIITLFLILFIIPGACMLVGLCFSSRFLPQMAALVLFFAGYDIILLHYRNMLEDMGSALKRQEYYPAVRFMPFLGIVTGSMALLLCVRHLPLYSLSAFWLSAHLIFPVSLFLYDKNLWLHFFRERNPAPLTALTNACKKTEKTPLLASFASAHMTLMTVFFISDYLVLQKLLTWHTEAASFAGALGLLLLSLAGALSFVAFLYPHAIEHMEARNMYLMMPVTAIICFGAMLLYNGYWSAIALFINRYALGLSHHHETEHRLFESLPRQQKLVMQSTINLFTSPFAACAAGIIILAATYPELQNCAWYIPLAGLVLSLLALRLFFSARHEYLRFLITLFKDRYRDLFALTQERRYAICHDAAVILQGIHDPDDRICIFYLRSLKRVAHKRLIKPLMELLPGKSPLVQGEIVQILGEMRAEKASDLIKQYLNSPEPSLKAQCLQALDRIPPGPGSEIIEASLEDSHPEVRGKAAILACKRSSLCEQGTTVIKSMMTHEKDEMKCWGAYAAGQTGNRSLFYHLVPLISSSDFSVRLKTMEAMERMMDYNEKEYRSLFLNALGDRAPAIRLQALRILARFGPDGLVPAIVTLLADRNANVRREAIVTLAAFGESILEELKGYLYDRSERIVESAIVVASSIHTRSAMDFLFRFLEIEFRYMYRNFFSLQALEKFGSEKELLVKALEDYNNRVTRHALILLESLERQAGRLEEIGYFPIAGPDKNAQMKKLFLQRMEKRLMRYITPLLDQTTVQDYVRAAARIFQGTIPREMEALQENLYHPDRWIIGTAFHFLKEIGQSATISEYLEKCDAHSEGGKEMMEQILILKKIPIFLNLTLDQLKDISESTEEKQFSPGEMVFEEGDRGNEMYIIYSGKVKILRQKKDGKEGDEIVLAELGPQSYFGEMALLDDSPRSASAKVVEPAIMTILTREMLYNSIYEKPEIAMEICRVLSTRLREANKKIQEVIEGASGAADQGKP